MSVYSSSRQSSHRNQTSRPPPQQRSSRRSSSPSSSPSPSPPRADQFNPSSFQSAMSASSYYPQHFQYPQHQPHHQQIHTPSAPDSPLIYVHSLHSSITETDLLALCQPFGPVLKITIAPSTSSAFPHDSIANTAVIHMSSVESANGLFSFYAHTTLKVKGRTIHLSQSPNSPRAASSSPTITHRSLQQSLHNAPPTYTQSSVTPSRSLMVTLSPHSPLTIPQLTNIFAQFGSVTSHRTLTRNRCQISFAHTQSAERATDALNNVDGINIAYTSSSPTMNALNSTLADLTLSSQQNQQSLYSHGAHPSSLSAPEPSQYSYYADQPAPPTAAPVPQYSSLYPSSVPATVPPVTPVLLVTGLPTHPTHPPTPIFSCDELFSLFGVYGDVLRVKILYHTPSSALIQLHTPIQAQMCMTNLNQLKLYNRTLTVLPSRHSEVALPHNNEGPAKQLTKEYIHSPMHRFRGKSANMASYLRALHPPTPVLHVSSLATSVSEQQVKELFGLDQANDTIVQFIDGSAAAVAPASPQISAAQQSHPLVATPPSPTPSSSSSSMVNKHSPALIPHRQAFVKLPSIQAAVLALIRMHNAFVNGRYVRVSFSRKEPALIRHDSPRHSHLLAAHQQGQSHGGRSSPTASPLSSPTPTTPTREHYSSRQRDAEKVSPTSLQSKVNTPPSRSFLQQHSPVMSASHHTIGLDNKEWSSPATYASRLHAALDKHDNNDVHHHHHHGNYKSESILSHLKEGETSI